VPPIQTDPFIVRDHLDGFLNNRQGSQSQEVHLQQTDFFHMLHVVLRGDFPLGRFEQGDKLRQFIRRNHNACRMGRSMPGQSLQGSGVLHELLIPLIGIDQFPEIFCFQRFFQGHSDLGGNQLGQAVGFSVG